MNIKVTYRKDKKTYMVDARKIGGNRVYIQDKKKAHLEAAKIEKLYNSNNYIPQKITGEYAIDKFISSVPNMPIGRGAKTEKINYAKRLKETKISGIKVKDWDLKNLILPGVRDPEDIELDLKNSKPMMVVVNNPKKLTSWNTRTHCYGCYIKIFNSFVRRNYMSMNPIFRTSLAVPDDYIVGDVKAEKIHPDTIKKVQANIAPDFSLIFQLAISTGIRQGEQRSLMWKHIDWDNKEIKIHQVVRVGDYGEEISLRLKTKQSKRQLPLSEKLYQLLKEEYLKQGRPNNPDAFIFSNKNNRWLGGDIYRNSLQDAINKSGVDKFGWHDLRHYFASVMFDTMGINYAYVSQVLGHKSTDFTRQQYVHWFKNTERDNKVREGMATAGI